MGSARSAQERKEEPVSGRQRPGEPACAPGVLSVVGRRALSTRQPCQPVARNQEPAKVFQVYAAAARVQAEELQMWNADGTIGVSGELAVLPADLVQGRG